MGWEREAVDNRNGNTVEENQSSKGKREICGVPESGNAGNR
jgi:hypothetical protein